MATADAAVERLIAHRWNDWLVTDGEQRVALAVLRTDTDLAATIGDLNASAMLRAVIERLPTCQITPLLGGGCDAGMKATIRSMVVMAVARATGGGLTVALPGEFDIPRLFDLSFDIQNGFRAMGASFSAIPFNETSFASLIPSTPDAPFSGAAATGTSPVTLRIGPADQALLLAGDRETTARYTNPVPADLFAYLAGLPAGARAQQASLLLGRPLARSCLIRMEHGCRRVRR